MNAQSSGKFSLCFLSGSCTTKGEHQFHKTDSVLPVQCVCLSIQEVRHGQQNGTFKALHLAFSYIISLILCAAVFNFEVRDGELSHCMNYPELK